MSRSKPSPAAGADDLLELERRLADGVGAIAAQLALTAEITRILIAVYSSGS
ncbi:MAG: hypothetical protein IT384_28545 [Deltaproteobacteria bacterium]|nr:hypothetical protein [Deltaproteobacteria bacterium]